MQITFYRIACSCLKIFLTVAIILCSTRGWVPTGPVEVALTAEQMIARDHLRRVVETLARDIGIRNYSYPDQLKAARDFIAEEFRSLGYEVYLQTYQANGQEFSNVIAVKGGFRDADYVLAGAHYDTCFNSGADDNASGVAGVLGLARILAEDPAGERVIFAAFVNEEAPFYNTDAMGSRVFVQSLQEARFRVRFAVIFEMIGYYSNDLFSQSYFAFLGPFYPNRGNFISIISNFSSAALTRKLSVGFRASTAFPLRTLAVPEFLPATSFSDHLSFWQAGYPAVMVTDTAFMRNPHYHQSTDLPETLDYDAMTAVVYGFKGAIKHVVEEVTLNEK